MGPLHTEIVTGPATAVRDSFRTEDSLLQMSISTELKSTGKGILKPFPGGGTLTAGGPRGGMWLHTECPNLSSHISLPELNSGVYVERQT